MLIYADNKAGESQDEPKAVESGLWPALKSAAFDWSAHKSSKAGAAVAYYKKALNKPAISDDEATALYFQLGSVFQTMGETNEALYFFEKVMKRDANFRDARRRISDLRGGEGGRGFDALLGGKNHR